MRPTKTTTPSRTPSSRAGRSTAGPAWARQQVGLHQDVARGRQARGRDEDVAPAGGEHVGDVEAGRAARHRRDPLLQEDALHHLGLGLVLGADDAHELALGELRLDLARALVGLGHRLVDARAARVDQRHPAGRAEALVERVRRGAARAHQRLSHRATSTSTSTSAHDAVVDAIRAHRRLAVAAQADDQPLHPGPAGGEVDVGLRRIGLRARVRVVDGAELGALGLEGVLGLDDLAPVDLEAQRAGRDVGRLVDRDRVPVAHGRSSRSTRWGSRAARARRMRSRSAESMRTTRSSERGALPLRRGRSRR